eukprot:CAMPEP_0174918022 /NCGR_PEP_ID=MMETSP1355-20121228/2845_1 /TAXON_ID=464990 /ORGANISM="Hemiselmis tepida, Strain CCMP443" /LENGTH=572 /DNA_ID=CAMNT_0016163179 /DNA_START=43 /DNA_END=1758 /DNA_ORIENTATION=+
MSSEAQQQGARRRVVAAPASSSRAQEDRENSREDDPDGTSYEPPENMPEGTIAFRYNKFQHNARIACFMLPCMGILMAYGGKTTTSTVVAGAMVTYMLDFYGWREGTLIAVWVTVVSSMATLFLASMHLFTVSIYNIALVYNMLAFCASAGLWGTLQFTQLQRENPRTVLICERLLFALMPATPPVLMTWATVAMAGAGACHYYLLAYLSAGFYLYVLPVRSSFRVVARGRSKKVGPAADELDELIMGRFESTAHAMCFVILPALIKTAVHHGHMYSTRDDLADVVLTHALPPLVIVALADRGSLWWMGIELKYYRVFRTACGAALVLAVAGAIEIRVVFHAFRQYIRVPYPYDYVAVTAGVYGLALMVLAHFSGVLESRGMWVPLTALGATAALGVQMALGMPFYMLPFGCAGAYFCVQFYYKRKLWDYVSFCGTAALVICWFIAKSFMFLDFEFDPLPMSIRHVCLVLMAVVLASLLLPGLVATSRRPGLVGGLLALHAAGMCVLELQLHCQFKGIYPPYLVALTTLVGLFLTSHLFALGKTSGATAWLMGCLYASKLGLLLHPAPLALP